MSTLIRFRKWRWQYMRGVYGILALPKHTIATAARQSLPLLPVSVVADKARSAPATGSNAVA
ncbi:hypothetical protein [Caballeronia sp. DA-9]|uniref:hypothetical protein n=1 Tax=Caballeronia sp. DA-9 TaxID=3436237 RepID=UPI003F66A0A2